MNLKSFITEQTNNNPFTQHIADEQFNYMLEQGFERGKLDGYAHLTGKDCYDKIFQKTAYSFEQAWDEMIDLVTNL